MDRMDFEPRSAAGVQRARGVAIASAPGAAGAITGPASWGANRKPPASFRIP
jgi:hypothetical protein